MTMTIQRQIKVLNGLQWALRALAIVGLGLVAGLLAAPGCSGQPESYTPVVVSAHGCGGLVIQTGPAVVAADVCDRTVQTPQGLRPCTVVESLSVSGMVIGRGALKAASDPACKAIYGWFPSGLNVGSRVGDGRDVGAESDAAGADSGGAGVAP